MQNNMELYSLKGRMEYFDTLLRENIWSQINYIKLCTLPSHASYSQENAIILSPSLDMTHIHIRPEPASLASFFSIFSLGVWEEDGL